MLQNTTFEKTSIYNSAFSCRIDNDNIFQTDYLGNNYGQIGVTVKKYKELKDICDSYYNKLVELGVIQKEKTEQEIALETQAIMKSMLDQIQSMQEQINKMKDNKNDKSCESVTDYNKDDRAKPSTATKAR